MQISLISNALALMHINKVGGEMLADFEAAMTNAGETRTVAQLVQMSGVDFLETNANEAMSTGQSGFGADFVQSTVLSTELIERMRNETSLLSVLPVHQMNNKTMDFPVRGTRIRMTGQSESNSYPGTTPGVVASQVKKAGTAKITMTAELLRVTVYVSDELIEDSVIGIAEYVIGEIVAAFDASIHELILNGDTDTGANTNVNIIDGNTSALPDGNATDFLKADGVRKFAIDNSLTVNAGANIDLSIIRDARALMGIKGLDPKKLVLVPDQTTYFELLNLSQAETIEKFGDAATVKEGVLYAIDGIRIINREEMLQAQAAGTISATAGNNILGQMALIHTPSVHVGIRRNLTTEESRYAEQGQTGMTGSARVTVEIDNTQNTLQASAPVVLIRNI
jgi:hypothetical protein